MPVYEYRCADCGYRFSLLEQLGAPETPKECPKCKSKETRRILSSFATKTSLDKNSGGCKPGGG